MAQRHSGTADPHGVLGVSPGASKQEVKEAYRKQVKQWHPDRNGSEAAQAKFQEIQVAYEQLSSSRRLRQGVDGGSYDSERMAERVREFTRRARAEAGRAETAAAEHAVAGLPPRILLGGVVVAVVGLGLWNLFVGGSDEAKQVWQDVTYPRAYHEVLKPAAGRAASRVPSETLVEAWYNPDQRRWELPDPDSAIYQQFRGTTTRIPESQVFRRKPADR